MGEVKVETEIEKWPLFIDATCQHKTNKSETSTPARDGTSIKDWNDPCTKASVVPNSTPQQPSATTTPSPILSITFILMVIGHVFELKSREVCEFNHETNDCNNGFGSECELQRGVLSPENKTIVAIPHTTATAINFTPTGVGICQASVIEHDLIDAIRPTSIQIIQGIKNENKTKIGGGVLWEHTQPHSPTATTTTGPTIDGINNYDSIDAESREFNDLECVFDVVLNENDSNYDIIHVFKYFSNENFNVNDNLNASCGASPGMSYIFNFWYFGFFILLTSFWSACFGCC